MSRTVGANAVHFDTQDLHGGMEAMADELIFFSDDRFPSLDDFSCLPSLPSSPASLSSAASGSHHRPPSMSSSSYSFSSPSPLVQDTDDDFGIREALDLWEACTESDPSPALVPDQKPEPGFLPAGDDCSSEELAKVFLDWLKSNKDSISAEDLRSIKLKRSTIESAARHLGGGKHGRAQLLKLILAWVQNNHLGKRKRCLDLTSGDHASSPSNYISVEPWPISAGGSCYYSQRNTPLAFPASGWQRPYNNQPPAYSHGMGVNRLASVTKEARKKRMARHRKFPRNQNQQSSPEKQVSGSFSDLSITSNSSKKGSFSPMGNSGTEMRQDSDLQSHALRGERRRGLKVENLRFLLQKVLKQSDVGSLGRIVLPKKEAEIHLPDLEARDGISIEMEDIGTSKVWNMRYRFWPNNKSRMYLLENTGDFVQSNGLQEGDFIVIYSDVKCGKYMIRGVKVRQPLDGMKGKAQKKGSCKPIAS